MCASEFSVTGSHRVGETIGDKTVCWNVQVVAIGGTVAKLLAVCGNVNELGVGSGITSCVPADGDHANTEHVLLR